MHHRDKRGAFSCASVTRREDLELRKLYERLPDKVGTREGYVRVVDESGEDYLYPEGYFVAVEVPRQAERAFARRIRMRASNAPMQRPALARRR